jgi:predicted ATPase
VSAKADRVTQSDRFPFALPFVASLDLDLSTPVTFFVGENGSGKSTLLEAIAEMCGLPARGGGKNEVELAGREGSALAGALSPAFRNRPRDGFFFRAEAQLEFAELLEQRASDPDFKADPYTRYGGRTLKSRSHGEAFFEVFANRFDGGLYLLDEPESALSPERQLAFLVLLDTLVRIGHTQIIAATHSPILLTYPEAAIVSFDAPSLPRIRADDTTHVRLTRDVLANPALYWHRLRDGA